MTVSKHADARWRSLQALVKLNKSRQPEVLLPLLRALAEEVLNSDAPNRVEAGESILRSARTLEPMIGLAADFEWSSLSFIRKLQEGFDAAGWKQRRTDELLQEGHCLVFP